MWRRARAGTASPQHGVLLVTSAAREPVDEAIWFGQRLEADGLPFAGEIVNRVHHDLLGDPAPR